MIDTAQIVQTKYITPSWRIEFNPSRNIPGVIYRVDKWIPYKGWSTICSTEYPQVIIPAEKSDIRLKITLSMPYGYDTCVHEIIVKP